MPPRLLSVIALLVFASACVAPRAAICKGFCALAAEKPEHPIRHLRLGAVRPVEVIDLIQGLQEAVEANESEVVVDIDSPGGSVMAGLAVVTVMTEARHSGTSITCNIADGGMAASMGAVIFEAGCSKRYMAPTASLMFHEPSVNEIGGKESDLRRWANALSDMNKRLAILIAPHLRMTAAQYISWVSERDRWVGYDEALEMGAIDGNIQ